MICARKIESEKYVLETGRERIKEISTGEYFHTAFYNDGGSGREVICDIVNGKENPKMKAIKKYISLNEEVMKKDNSIRGIRIEMIV